LLIIERNKEIVKDKTKKRSITFSQDMPLFSGGQERKFNDYQPPQQARTGATDATSVAAMMSSSNASFFMISPPLGWVCRWENK
jgi:hypothetical protein